MCTLQTPPKNAILLTIEKKPLGFLLIYRKLGTVVARKYRTTKSDVQYGHLGATTHYCKNKTFYLESCPKNLFFVLIFSLDNPKVILESM